MDRSALARSGQGPLAAAISTASMPRVVITGCPGAGKTTLLAELAARGYTTVEESARAIIADRLASGASRRPDRLAFAREILRRDIEKYFRHADMQRMFALYVQDSTALQASDCS